MSFSHDYEMEDRTSSRQQQWELPELHHVLPPAGVLLPQGDDLTSMTHEQAVAEIEHCAVYQRPSVAHAGGYCLSLVITVTYIILLTYSLLYTRDVSTVNRVFRSATDVLGSDDLAGVNTIKGSVEFINTVAVPTYIRGFLDWNANYTKRTEGTVFGGSTIMSPLRFRQHRAVNGCDRPTYLAQFGLCRKDAEDSSSPRLTTTSFVTSKTRTIVPYSTSESLCQINVQGQTYELKKLCGEYTITGATKSARYPSSGYVHDIDVSALRGRLDALTTAKNSSVLTASEIKSIAKEATAFLGEQPWIDRNTRVLIVEFSMMMSNQDRAIFASPALAFEFLAEGVVVPQFSVLPFNLSLSMRALDYIVIVFSALVVATWIAPIVRAVTMPRPCVLCRIDKLEDFLLETPWYLCTREGCGQQFDRFENEQCPSCEKPVCEWSHTCVRGAVVNFGLLYSLAQLALNVAEFLMRKEAQDALNERLDVLKRVQRGSQTVVPFMDFAPLQDYMSTAFILSVFAVLLAYFSFYSFIRHFNTFDRFLRLFQRGAKNLITFIITFAVPFTGFAFAFHITFGPRTKGFQYAGETALSTFRMMLGDVSFADLLGEIVVSTIALYVVFGVVATLIALNVFIAIVGFAYESALEVTPHRVVKESLKNVLRSIIPKSRRGAGQVVSMHTTGGEHEDLEEIANTLRHLKNRMRS